MVRKGLFKFMSSPLRGSCSCSSSSLSFTLPISCFCRSFLLSPYASVVLPCSRETSFARIGHHGRLPLADRGSLAAAGSLGTRLMGGHQRSRCPASRIEVNPELGVVMM